MALKCTVMGAQVPNLFSRVVCSWNFCSIRVGVVSEMLI